MCCGVELVSLARLGELAQKAETGRNGERPEDVLGRLESYEGLRALELEQSFRPVDKISLRDARKAVQDALKDGYSREILIRAYFNHFPVKK